MFKHIIFDWTGPVRDVDTQLWVINKMFEYAGTGPITMQEMRQNWEQPYMLFYNKYVPGWTLEQEQAVYHKIIAREDCPVTQPYCGVVDLIKKLNERNIEMAVLSSDSTATIFPEIKRFGVDGIFKEVISNSHDKAKEIHDLIERNKFNKEETVFIGDSNHEIEVGKQAGIKTLAITWGLSTKENLKAMSPDYLVDSVGELAEILLK